MHKMTSIKNFDNYQHVKKNKIKLYKITCFYDLRTLKMLFGD